MESIDSIDFAVRTRTYKHYVKRDCWWNEKSRMLRRSVRESHDLGRGTTRERNPRKKDRNHLVSHRCGGCMHNCKKVKPNPSFHFHFHFQQQITNLFGRLFLSLLLDTHYSVSKQQSAGNFRWVCADSSCRKHVPYARQWRARRDFFYGLVIAIYPFLTCDAIS